MFLLYLFLIGRPHGELPTPTIDINTIVTLITSMTYFFVGSYRKKDLSCFGKYIKPSSVLLPINILEDFTRSLSLSCQLFLEYHNG